MAKIALRAVLNPGQKVYGQLTDRFFFGYEVCNLDYSVLPLLDSKRDFRFYDRKLNATVWRSTVADANLASLYSSGGNAVAMRAHCKKDEPINELYSPPFFYSSSMAYFRNQYNQSCANFPGLIGNFKGPSPVLTIDAQGAGGDLLAPGTKLVASKTGVIHKYTEQGNFEAFVYPTGSTARDSLNGGTNLANHPMVLGYGPLSAQNSYPYNETLTPVWTPGNTSAGCPGYWAQIKQAGLIYQDATYVTFFQVTDQYGSVGRFVPSTTGPGDKCHMTAVRKSDGYQYQITMATQNCFQAACGFTFKAVTTTEGTPQKACVVGAISNASGSKVFSLNKLIGITLTNVGSIGWTNNTYTELVPTQIMENKDSAFSTHWKMYIPMAGSYTDNENLLTLQLIRFNKTLLTNSTITACTLSGIPAEYCSANGDGTKIKCAYTPKPWASSKYDACFAVETYDGADQYITYFIGRTRNGDWHTDVDANSYSEMSDQAYRWMLTFKVSPTNDSVLTFSASVPEFKFAKPMYCYAATPDNKYMVMANADGLYCFAWSTTTKGFICTDSLALPGVVSLGIDENQVAGKCTVMVEVLQTPTAPEDSLSSIYQVDSGDYEDVDLRYFNGSAYVTDFGYNSLALTMDGNGFTSQTINMEVRVKNKVGAVETAFVAGKTVKLKISGVRETDGAAFVGYDSGNPYQKTITSSADWQTVQFTIKNPLSAMKITGEITA